MNLSPDTVITTVPQPVPDVGRQTRFVVTLPDAQAQVDLTAELRELGPHVPWRRLFVVHRLPLTSEAPHCVVAREGYVACVSEACGAKPCDGERAVRAHLESTTAHPGAQEPVQ